MKFFGDVFQVWPATPFPHSYWVEPGRLLAGEYPGATRHDPVGRVPLLLDAGITSFIDLTAEGELSPYHADLGHRAIHRRFPIMDHGLPNSPATMDAVVAAIEKDLADGRRVYLHCRAGIGRTGMAAGCYLIQRGTDGPTALEKLQELWRRNARSKTWPSVPETEEQVRYVREWIAPRSRVAAAPTQRIEASLLGLAIGDGFAQLGLKVSSAAAWLAEAQRSERLISGADTAMTLAAAESLLTLGKHDSHDQLSRYAAWAQRPGNQARLPAELKRVLAMWQWARKPNPGSHDPKNLDAHPLARSLAPALFSKGDAYKAAELGAEVCRSTLQAPLVLDVVRVWTATLVTTLNGATKADIVSMTTATKALHGRALKPEIAALLNGNWNQGEARDAISAVATTLAIFRTTASFEAALAEAGTVAPNCGALIGSLAGAHYGIKAVPSEWVQSLADAASIAALARRFER